MKRICVIGTLVFLLNFPAKAQQPGRLTLAEAVKTALNNNLNVQVPALQAETDQINWNQAKFDRYPDLNGSGNNGVSQGRSIDPFTNSYSNQKIGYASYGISSNVVLFNGFSLKHRVRQNELTYQASVLDWQQAKDNLTIDVILAYLDVLNNGDLLEQAKIQSNLTLKQIERLAILDSNGAVAPYLLSDMRGQSGTDKLTIVNIQTAGETALVALFRLMNIPFNKNVVLEKIGTEDVLVKYANDPATIYMAALEQFPRLKATELRKQSAEKSVQVAKAQMFPIVSLNGAATTNYSNAARNEVFVNTTDIITSDFVNVGGNKISVVRPRDNYSSQKIAYGKQLNNNLATSLNLNVRVPIFNSFQGRNRIKLAQIQYKNAELVAMAAKTELQQFIEEAYINLNSTWERYKILLDQVNAYQQSYRAAEIRFNAGLGTSVDFLTAKTNLERARNSLISARYDYLLRTKILDYYQGKLSL